jgi:hypothetical protein
LSDEVTLTENVAVKIATEQLFVSRGVFNFCGVKNDRFQLFLVENDILIV